MKRKAILIRSFLSDYNKLVSLYFDKEYESEILKFLKKEKHLKKFSHILEILKIHRFYNDLYGIESEILDNKRITAFKFKSFNNTRIYCLDIEYEDEVKIILSVCFKKKSQKIDKKILKRLEIISGYDYIFED